MVDIDKTPDGVRDTEDQFRILPFARQQPLQDEVHDLAALVRDFEPMLARAGTRTAFCEVKPSYQPTFASVAVPRFEAALLNLLVNAVDAMPDGGIVPVASEVVESRTALSSLLPAGRYVKVSVSGGYGNGHTGGCVGSGLRAVLYHQASEGDGSWAEPGVRVHYAIRR